MKASLTERELKVIDMLAQAAMEFSSLPVCHQSDEREFESAVHVCQNIIMARAAVRTIPGVFNSIKRFK